MKFSHYFINRPIFASVISIVIFLLGVGAYIALPVAQYPNVAPPMVYVYTKYIGASPEVVMNSVVAPIEQALNGVEGMIYMQSQTGSDGTAQVMVTFETGTDIDMAQVRVQNRVSETLSRLPKEVRDTGVTVRKRSPDLLIWINLYSPKGTRDKLYLTNYAITQMQDRLSRIYGISEFGVWGAKEYCMRIWLDPDRLSALDVTPKQVIDALQEQNKQIAAGMLNAPPLDSDAAFELIINAQGRLETEREFGNIIIKYLPDGRIIYLRDVARIELGSYVYGNESYINNRSAVTMGAYQLPNANAIELSKKVKQELEEMKKSFPPDVDYVIGYDATEFISESISAVYRTIGEAILLVVLVVLLFLQNWRAAIIPLFAIPVSLVGTFAVMYLFGFSINNLSLFGLVLAIGIVVDDAIVVVENVERNMRLGLKVKEATEQAMTQVQGAVIAIALVLSCVFVPTAFMGGISGEFYKQTLAFAGCHVAHSLDRVDDGRNIGTGVGEHELLELGFVEQRFLEFTLSRRPLFRKPFNGKRGGNIRHCNETGKFAREFGLVLPDRENNVGIEIVRGKNCVADVVHSQCFEDDRNAAERKHGGEFCDFKPVVNEACGFQESGEVFDRKPAPDLKLFQRNGVIDFLRPECDFAAQRLIHDFECFRICRICEQRDAFRKHFEVFGRHDRFQVQEQF